MIPQMHDDKIQGEEQLPSPVEEKKTGAHLEEQRKQIPPRPQRSRQWLMRILGVALPLVVGFIAIGPWSLYNFDRRTGLFLGYLVVCLTVFVGAILLRSWWSLLILPGAAIIGIVLGNFVVFPLIQGGVPMMQESIGNFLNSVGAVVMIVFVPLMVIALIGTPLGIRFWRWWEMRKIRQQTKSLYIR